LTRDGGGTQAAALKRPQKLPHHARPFQLPSIRRECSIPVEPGGETAHFHPVRPRAHGAI